jgi:short-subunit dehydrogenase
MNSSFADQCILITGASDGIGAELARQLAAPGVKLVLAARSREGLEATALAAQAKGAEVLVQPTDVSDEAQCQALVAASIARFGRLDALVNNAGVSMHAWFEDTTDFSTYERLFKVNVMSAVWLTRDALPHLKKTGGLIMGISSLAGKTGVPARTAYCTSKFAMSGFFEALRIELDGSGVAVSMVFPGVVATNIRRNGLDAAGGRLGVSGLAEEGAMPVDECAAQIMQAMRSRPRELIMTAKGRFGMKLKAFAPQLVDNMARKALSKEGHKKQ